LLTPEEMYGELASAGAAEASVGLCSLAAATRQAGFGTQIIDAVALNLKNDELAAQIVAAAPDFVGISVVTLAAYNAGDLAEKIKKLNPEIITLIGGVHITSVPEETMKRFPAFDIGIIGEAEITIAELLKALRDKRKLADIPGLVLRQEGALIKTPKREFIKDLDSLPLPAWDLLPDLHQYYKPPAWSLNQDTSMLIISSRGCSNACIYCDRGCFGTFVRIHSADYVFKMIKDLYENYGVKQFRINDDNFILFKSRTREICHKIIESKLPIKWSCFGRADSVEPEMLALMKQAGCWQISYGVETGSQEIHNLENKNLTLQQIEDAIALTKKMGISTIGFTMIAHPNETKETIKSTVRFCKRLALDDFKMVFLTPYPNTPLYHYAEKYGTLNKDWRKMNAYTEPCFVPYGVTKQELIKYRKLAYWQFYLRPKIIFSHLSQIENPKQIIVLVKGFFSLMKLWLGIK